MQPSPPEPAFVVLGAGVAGLATAWRLAAQRRLPVLVLERDTASGGLAGTISFAGGRFDLGSHRIHPEYFPDAFALLRQLLGDSLLCLPRRGRLRLNGTYIDYPPRLTDFLGALGPAHAARCAVDLLRARLRPTLRSSVPQSYEDELLPRVGQHAFDLFFAPYARKVFGLEPSQVSATAAKTRITTSGPWTAVGRMLRDRISAGRNEPRVFYYPADGFGSIGAALHADARDRGVIFHTGVEVLALQGTGDRIDTVDFRTAAGETHTRAVEAVISTVPLATLTKLVAPAAPASVAEAVAGLRWRAIRLLQVVLDGDHCLDGETYYFPEQRYCFGRVSEPPLFSSRLRPAVDRTGLTLEVICTAGDAVWSLDEAAFFAHVMRDAEAADLFHAADVQAYQSVRLPAVYPVYDLDYRARVQHVLGWIDSFANLYSIGRGGMFLHANTDHSIHLGLCLGEHLADGGSGRWQGVATDGFRVRD